MHREALVTLKELAEKVLTRTEKHEMGQFRKTWEETEMGTVQCIWRDIGYYNKTWGAKTYWTSLRHHTILKSFICWLRPPVWLERVTHKI